MALTKISTGGVKDDTASQAIIADEAVDEARLQISNAGSNGEFLQKQSGNTGGLTWAAANQYTHPNHSGEVTSTADGAQVIADNIVDEANLKVDNTPTNDHVLTAKSSASGGLTWAAAGGGAWEVISSTLLTSGCSGTLANNGWSNAYQNYKVVITGINKDGAGCPIWIRWYMDTSPTSTGTGTLKTNDKYKAHSFKIGPGGSEYETESTYHKLWDESSPDHWANVELTFPMSSYTGDAKKGCFGTIFSPIHGLYVERCFWDHNTEQDEHIKGIQITWDNGNTSDLGGRVTFLRQKYS